MSDPGSVVTAEPGAQGDAHFAEPGPQGLADRLIELFEPASVLDAGCGSGRLVGALRERGVDAEGIDRSGAAIADADGRAAGALRVADPAEPLGRRYDLIIGLDGLEPLEAGRPDLARAEAVLANLAAATDLLLIPSRPEWAALLAGQGFVRRFDAPFVSPGALLLERRELTAGQLVREYETALLGQAGDDADQRGDAGLLRADVDAAVARLGELEPLRAAVLTERARAEAAERQLAAALAQARTAQEQYARLSGSSRVRVANAAASRLARVRRSRLGKAILRRLR